MKEVVGKYNTAKVFTDVVDASSLRQIELLCNQEFTSGAKIRMMPDVHAGAGCTIGTTMTIADKIVPNLVGVDIGCGMETVVFAAHSEFSQSFDPVLLDRVIRRNIPSGFDVRDSHHQLVSQVNWDGVRAKFSKAKAKLSLGTLGGGNHFIEVDRDDEGNLYLVVHSGSRHAGLEVANFYQEEAWKQINGFCQSDVEATIASLRAQGRHDEIEPTLRSLRSHAHTDIPKDLAYVSGTLFSDYLNDMAIMQHFAHLNRVAMVDVILRCLHVREADVVERFTTIHNYIDLDNMILRKGAVSAQQGQKLLIPINMRDGSLVCVGKGNDDWNCSAPHGAGRILSRSQARHQLSLQDFQAQMSGVFSSTVSLDTIDEAPMAYKSMRDIVDNIGPTADVVKVIKPIYNFKAAEVRRGRHR